MKDCVFCKIVKGEIKIDFVFNDKEYVVFNSNEPAAEYHLLVVPKKHVNTFLDLDGNSSGMITVAQTVIRKLKFEGGYKIIFNGGKYQSVPHVHLHVLSGKLELNDDILSKT